MKGQNKLFFAIIIALIIGVLLGGFVNKFERGTEIRVNTNTVDAQHNALDEIKFETTDGQKLSQKIFIFKDEKQKDSLTKAFAGQDILLVSKGDKTVIEPNVLKNKDVQIKTVEKSQNGRFTAIDNITSFSEMIKLLGTIFIRLVQMIIAPLVFTTLVVGIAKMSDISMIGRVGTKAMAWFLTASLVSLLIGLALVNWMEPGKMMQLEKPAAEAAGELMNTAHNGLSLEQFVSHVIPKSVFEAFATNEVLQIVIVQEQDGILYISGNASNSAAKDTVWNALGSIDPNYTATDINIDVKVSGLAAGASLTVATDESNLNIRQEASTEASILGKASKGSTVTLVEQSSDDWWKVRTADGVEGYAYARYLKA